MPERFPLGTRLVRHFWPWFMYKTVHRLQEVFKSFTKKLLHRTVFGPTKCIDEAFKVKRQCPTCGQLGDPLIGNQPN